jgi:hypothetical protein
MAHLNAQGSELSLKIVYFGPDVTAAARNVRWLHEAVNHDLHVPLIEMPDDGGARCLAFSFEPAAEIVGSHPLRIRARLYALEGAPGAETKRLLFRGADAIVLVVKPEHRVEAMREALAFADRAGGTARPPLVLQLDGWMLPSADELDAVRIQLATPPEIPIVPAACARGDGIARTLAVAVERALARWHAPGANRAG